ncbi:ribonuclease R [Candidatus Kinetoplastibacterium blastocrithidii TCC012E]|uniref:Ribonuclease R n=1 Tax=Candidatus Kinetoplastidibacterium blastocrithidiae TCC012E TaxID=1208922 RepID=M1LBH9_9PROT|nr:ribonuclease R [Candidatus Kinetoplastibacterium blastocrithidii]AFZ83666.1 ribonuclease R [Candidatus Kinetoplastibacterium blastocrithidii (ex Strigomonas culicis)]AGF49788.1 ribonuclease R [Candidatus Kinetoplastibacterium blastocrithidii TCC012E]
MEILTLAKLKNTNNSTYTAILNSDHILIDPNVPSREDILYAIRKNGSLNKTEIKNIFPIKEESALSGIYKRLFAMEKDGQIIINNEFIIENKKTNFIYGQVICTKSGNGFLKQNSHKKSNLYIPQKEMMKVFNGDWVNVRKKINHRTKKSEYIIVEVVKRSTNKLLGKVITKKGVSLCIPINNNINREIILTNYNDYKLRNDYVARVKITRQPSKYLNPLGVIIDVIGNIHENNIENKIAVENFNIPSVFSKEVIDESESMLSNITESDIRTRTDLRNLPFITIDDDNAKDFDDAIYCEEIYIKHGNRKKTSYRLLVAIADVSHYVKKDTVLDKISLERGTSIYFSNEVIPMLPEKLSNNICSLLPGEDRLVLVCELLISSKTSDKEIKDNCKFYEAVINSKKRLTYNNIIDIKNGIEIIQDIPVNRNISALSELFNILIKKRINRGSIDFDIPEAKILFNKKGKVSDIVTKKRNDAHRMVEECMLLANTCAAYFIEKNKIECLYRVHDKPSKESIKNLKIFLNHIGINITNNFNKPKHYQNLINLISTHNKFNILQTLLLQSLQTATYSVDNIGHFGLSFDIYAHFTSPIRRYPDLINHRIIKHIICNDKNSNIGKINPIYTYDDLEKISNITSCYERRALEASRYADNWLKCIFAKKFEGKSFPGLISAVTNIGIFITIDSIKIDGFMPIIELKSKFKYNKTLKYIECEISNTRYQVGDTVLVEINKIIIESGQIFLFIINNSTNNR